MLAAILVGSLAAGTSRAGSDPKAVVVKVGPLEMTQENFLRDLYVLAEPDTSSLTPDRAGVDRFLDGYVQTLLLHAWAMEDSNYATPAERYMMELGDDQVLQEALRNEILPRYVTLDDALLRSVHDRMATELRLQVIRTATLARMDSARAGLAGGMRFEEAARRWSEDPTTSARGGEMGWLAANRFPLEQQRILWALPKEGISPPLTERQFHSLYRVADRRPAPDRKSFKEQKEEIRRSVIQTELPRVAQEMREDLMSSWEFHVDLQAAEWLREFLHRETASARRTFDPKLDRPFTILGQDNEGPFWKEAPLKGADAERPIATMRGDTLSALEVIDELVFQPTLVWPRFESVDDVVRLCESALYYRMQLAEARELGLDRRADVQRELKERQRWARWRSYRRVRLVPSIAPSEAELRALYAQRYEGRREPELRRFVLVNAPDRDLALQVAALLREGYVPSTIVERLGSPGVQFHVTPDTTMGWVAYGRFPGIDAALFRLKEGEVSEPILEKGRFSVLRVERISPAHEISFEEVAGKLSDEIIAGRERKAKADLIEKARARFDVWVDRAAIDRIELDASRFHRKPTRG